MALSSSVRAVLIFTLVATLLVVSQAEESGATGSMQGVQLGGNIAHPLLALVSMATLAVVISIFFSH
ncbi:hypothetical protein V1264_021788 [Littorina saxatilis]|uniref:Uncharacterized protein n=1 Tax=Littorina saxatilis TaxID=31220 RepID=A0AAN9FWQ8_9CAEN